MENYRCRYTPEWRDPHPRDEYGMCLCGSCAGHRRRQKELKERQRKNLDDAYVCRVYGKSQCQIEYEEWKLISTLRAKIKLDRKINELI